ncbi:MAG: hypothetical protein ACRETU_00780 [Steroidobacterales bacterium]
MRRSKSCLVGAILILTACGGGGYGGGGGGGGGITYTIGGMVTGLTGAGLVLQDNGGGDLAVAADGAFTFTAALANGSGYAVTVKTQPSSPTQNCVVTQGTGTVGNTNVTDVAIACTATPLTALTNQPPVPGELTLLLTDGSVMMQAYDAGVFYRLTPDANGSYLHGTWSQLASPPVGYAPYAGAEAVLADGRVLFVGGEYNQNDYALFAPSGLTNMSAVYDPAANHWTMIAPPPGVAYIGDATSVVMPDGSFIFGDKLGLNMWRLNPATLTWSAVPNTGKADVFAEEGWALMPDGTLFTIDVSNPRHAEHFDPVTAHWYSDGNTPVRLTASTNSPNGLPYGPAPMQVVGGVTYGPGPAGTYFPPGETGPALLLPDGRVFATGSIVGNNPSHTAIYTPGATPADPGTFTVGPDFGTGDDTEDASAALLPSGIVLVGTHSGRFYEYDGANLSVTATLSVSGGDIEYFVLPLPSGEALVTGGVTQIYSDHGSTNPAWAPTITIAPATIARGSTYAISGTQFNGLSQAAALGDELQAATNYPLVRITNTASGHVAYARTHNHSTMGVATGSAIVSTMFDVAAATETGASSLVVVANGIASAPVSVTVN